ncbi:MAG: hypothetical protein QME28_04745 [Candidatus Saccharicenans sp.]|nr:hypothetical protein [Candidatus Saccharicenans sp.]
MNNKKKSFLRFPFALICLLLLAAGYSFSSEKLIIRKIGSWPQNGEIEPVCLYVEISYSMDLEHPEIMFLVNGKEAICQLGGGGFGGGYYDRSFYVYAGNPGEKNPEVILISKKEKISKSIRHELKSSGDILLLDTADNQIVLDNRNLNFYSAFFTDWNIQVNSNKQAFSTKEISKGIHLLSITPDFRKGWNEVTVSGRDARGQEKVKKFRFCFSRDGEVFLGDRFNFTYAGEDTKSYRTLAYLLGDSIEPDGEEETDARLFTLKDNFLSRLSLVLLPLKAAKTSSTTVKVVRAHWSLGEEVLSQTTLKVIAR